MATRLDEQSRATHKAMPITFEEWLQWDFEGGFSEWVDGEVIHFIPATELHQRLAGFLETLLTLFAQLHGLGKVRTGPYAMRAVPGGKGREPDVMFVATENLSRMQHEHI